MGKFSEIFRKADMLTPPVTFMVGGRSGHESIRGAILTIVATVVCIAAGVQTVLMYLQTDGPRISTSDGFSPESGPYNVYENKLLPIVFLYDNLKVIVPPNISTYYVTIGLTIWTTGSNGNVTDLSPPVVGCGELKSRLNARGETTYFEEKNIILEPHHLRKILNYGICIDTDGLVRYANVSGNYGVDPVISVSSFYITPCSRGDCLPANLVEGMAINVVVFKPLLKLNNYTDPVVYFPDQNTLITVSPRFTQYNNYVLSKIQIENSQNFFSKPVQWGSLAETNMISSFTQNRDASITDCSNLTDYCDAYIFFYIAASNHLTTLTRTYTGLLESIGAFGGFSSVVFKVAFLLHIGILMFREEVQKKIAERIFKVSFSKSSKPETTSRCQKCKCKKKNKAIPPPQQVEEAPVVLEKGPTDIQRREAALQLVKEGQDVESIVRELNTIKLLAAAVLRPEQSNHISELALKTTIAKRESAKSQLSLTALSSPYRIPKELSVETPAVLKLSKIDLQRLPSSNSSSFQKLTPLTSLTQLQNFNLDEQDDKLTTGAIGIKSESRFPPIAPLEIDHLVNRPKPEEHAKTLLDGSQTPVQDRTPTRLHKFQIRKITGNKKA